MTTGKEGTLSIIGGNFTKSTTVRLLGYGFLTTTFINSSSLTASLPAAIPLGRYAIEINDPTNGTAYGPALFTVMAAAITPTATAEITATPTASR